MFSIIKKIYRIITNYFFADKTKLFIDDLRYPIDNKYSVVRSYDEAIRFFKRHGIPNEICFDHDLGEDSKGNVLPDGFDIAKAIVEGELDGDWVIPENFIFSVHSQNPDGKKEIHTYLTNYLNFRNIKKDYQSLEKIEEYKFEDAYDIRDNGVGTINLDRAAKSEAFCKKVADVAKSMKNVKTTSHKPKRQ